MKRRARRRATRAHGESNDAAPGKRGYRMRAWPATALIVGLAMATSLLLTPLGSTGTSVETEGGRVYGQRACGSLLSGIMGSEPTFSDIECASRAGERFGLAVLVALAAMAAAQLLFMRSVRRVLCCALAAVGAPQQVWTRRRTECASPTVPSDRQSDSKEYAKMGEAPCL